MSARLVGSLAVVFSALYFVSDAWELAQGGFSRGQLWLTLLAEAAIPVFVVGLAVLQRPRLGRLGRISAWLYAAAYVVFTGSVVVALVNHTRDYDALTKDLGPLMLVPGAVMVAAGLGFGVAVLRARLLPAWTAVVLGLGVVLVAVLQSLPGPLLVAAGIRDLGFAGMGAAVLGPRRSRWLVVGFPAQRPVG
jgi:hypothetical protein